MIMHENIRTARQYIDLMLQGVISSEKLVRHYLDTIDQTDSDILSLIHISEPTRPY